MGMGVWVHFAAAAVSAALLFLVVVCGAEASDEYCELFTGRWVIDESYPLYNASSCPFMEKEFSCQNNGRPDWSYTQYRWKPLGCDLQRFNGVDLLKRWRGKSVMFVGDSLSRNQWQSLTCLLYSSLPNANYTTIRVGEVSTVTFQVDQTHGIKAKVSPPVLQSQRSRSRAVADFHMTSK